MSLTPDMLQSMKYFIRGGTAQDLLRLSVEAQVKTLNNITQATQAQLNQKEEAFEQGVLKAVHQGDDPLQRKIAQLESVQMQLQSAIVKEEGELKEERNDLIALKSQLEALRYELRNTPGRFDEASQVLSDGIINNFGKPDRLGDIKKK